MLKNNENIAKQLSKIVKVPDYISENTPEMIKTIIEQLKNSRSLTLISDGIKDYNWIDKTKDNEYRNCFSSCICTK